jgi:type I restriction enzyme S subunit
LWKGENPPFATVGVIRNTNFAKDGSIDDTDIAWLDVEAKKLKTRKLKFGDIILEKSGGGPKQPVGRVALFEIEEGDYSFSNFTSAIRVNDPRELDFRFLHKFLFWKYASGVTELMQSHSTGIRNLNAEAYKKIAVPLPLLPEQQRIVTILDEVFAGLATATANAEKNLKNARELLERYLSSVFAKKGAGWAESRIAEICTLQSGTTVEKALEQTKGDIPYLKVADMTFEGNEERIFSSSRFLNMEDIRPGRVFPIGTTIFPKRGGAILTNKKRLTAIPICADLNIMGVLPSEAILPELVFMYFLAVDMRKLGSGSSIPQINNYDIAPLPISFPQSKDEQKKLVDEFEEYQAAVRALADAYQKKLDGLAELRRSILQKVFSGELTSPLSCVTKEAAE